MEDRFDLDRRVGLFVYGCGDVGRRVAGNLLRDGYNVRGFIDRAAAEIRFCDGLPVYSVIELKDIFQTDNIVAIVLNNGMHHDNVAGLLFRHGIDRIIYSPMSIQSTYEHRQFMRRMYKFLLTGAFDKIKGIPVFRASVLDNAERIVEFRGNDVCFWCSTSMIEVREQYLDLFDWLSGKSVDLKSYFEFIGHTLPQLQFSSELRDSWLNSRRELFAIYEDALKYDTLFFTDAPSPAFWNDEIKRFTLIDGNTRAHYLIYKSCKHIPIITSIKDFESGQYFERQENTLEHFTVSDKSNIIIYGAAHLGKEALYRLKNKGFKVECFLDRRADELIEVEGVKVFRAEDYVGDKKNAIVILGVSNPMSVANRLYQLGFNKMIFKVVQWQNLPSNIQAISDAFQYLMNDKGSIENIPCYDPSMDIRFINNAVVRADSSSTVVRIPLDMIFVKSSDRQVYTYSELLNYIKAFSLERKDSFGMIEDYSNAHAIEKFNGWVYDLSGEERRSYTLATLNEFNLNIDFGMKYFDENPIKVTFEGNKFYIEDKYLFRVMFFVSKGILHIPAEMSNEDYEAWLNEPVLNDAVEYAKKYDLFTSYSMIEHPCMYNFPTARDIGGNSRFVKISNFLDEAKIDVRGMKIVDVGAYYGVMSRFFARMGASVTSVEMNTDEFGFEVELNKLLHFDNIDMFNGVIQDLKADDGFDMAILMNVLHWHLETGIAADIVKAVDKMTTKYLLHESGDEPEREKTIIRENSSFKNYTHICTTVGTGKIRELGFWIK